MNINIIITDDVYKLILGKDKIFVQPGMNQRLVREFDLDTVPHLVDYIRQKSSKGMFIYVQGFIDSNCLIIEKFLGNEQHRRHFW